MNKMIDFITQTVMKDRKYHYDMRRRMTIVFFPKLDHAYIEQNGLEFWYHCAGIFHAMDLHEEYKEQINNIENEDGQFGT